ncbi:MAG TPA: outer membrane protein assembly factor BamD, partial [Acidobacteriota bacterium]|nr:outer membrane protein assembly factor BamD [Acidobacteriota bacterium]
MRRRRHNRQSGFRQRAILLLVCLVAALSAAVVSSCGGSGPKPILSSDESYRRAMDLLERRKWENASLEFESFIFSYPGATRVDSAQFLLGMCFYNMEDYIRADDEFGRLRRRYPTSPLVVDADLLRGRSLLNIAPENPALDQYQTTEAIAQLRLFKDNHPLSPLVAVADSLLAEAYERLSRRDFKAGKLYHRMGRYRASRIMLQEVIDRFPESPLVPEALYYIADGYRRADSLDRAIEFYEK